MEEIKQVGRALSDDEARRAEKILSLIWETIDLNYQEHDTRVMICVYCSLLFTVALASEMPVDAFKTILKQLAEEYEKEFDF